MEIILFLALLLLLVAVAGKGMLHLLAELHLPGVQAAAVLHKMVLVALALLDKDMRAEILVVRQVTIPAVAVAVQEQ
jgi:hypothetical protein